MLTRSLINLGSLLWLFCFDAYALSWEYREWTTKPSENDGYTMNATGQVIAGHTLQLGFVGDECNSPDKLSLTWSSYEKGLEELIGSKLDLSVEISGETYPLEMRLVAARSFTALMDVALLTTSAIPESLFEMMKNGQKVSFDIIGPQTAAEKFDVTEEFFDLTGFTANALKVKSACRNGVAELKIPPRVSNEELALLEFKRFNETKFIPNKAINVVDSSASEDCQRPLNLNVAQHLMSQGIQTITSFENYFVIAESRDGGHPYPPIRIFNACDPMNLMPVVDVPGTGQQVFDLVISNERLYALSNNHSVLGRYEQELPDVLLQVIDISDINNVIILGELEFDGLVPDMAVVNDQVFIAENDSVVQIDASNPRDLKWTEREYKFDAGKYGIDDLAATRELIFVIGTKGLQARSTSTGKLITAQHLPDRPRSVFIDENQLLIGFSDRTMVIPTSQGAKTSDDILHSGLRPTWFKLENLLMDRYGRVAVDLNDPSKIVQRQ